MSTTPDSSIAVPNTGSAPVETDLLTKPDGSQVHRQIVELGDGYDIGAIRSMLEQIYVQWMVGGPNIGMPSGQTVRLDEFGNLEVSTNVALSGGAKVFRLIALATTNSNLVKPAAGQVYGWYLFNAAAATRFVKLYNKERAPTVGTDPPVLTLGIPAGAAANVWFASGIGAFPLGIGLGITTNAADTDATAVTAGDVIAQIFYS